MKHLLLLLLLPVYVQAQSVSIGHSVKFWGKAQNMTEINVSYSDLTLHYFHSFSDDNYFVVINDKIHTVGNIQNSFALSYTPLKYKFIYSGIIISNNKFPIEKGSRFNFIIGAELNIKRLTISYKHISNGFGIQNPINVGSDLLSISYQF